MLLDKDTNPSRSLYYSGARLLQILSEHRFGSIDLNLAYRRLNEHAQSNERISFDYFMLTVDWLYLLDAVDVTDTGDIRKCF